MSKLKHALLALTVVSLATISMADAVVPVFEKHNLPPIWQNVPVSERLMLLRAAQMDAITQLAERVYGFQLNSETTIHDFAMQTSDSVSNQIRNCIYGAHEVSDPQYTKEGIVRIAYGLNIATVIKIISENKNHIGDDEFLVNNSSRLNTEKQLITVYGNSAIKGSVGFSMVLAKRMAELDAYRQMCQRFTGLKIDRNTSVRDFIFKQDNMRSSLDARLKGIRPTKITYLDDGTCLVEMQLKIREVVKIVEQIARRSGYDGKISIEKLKTVNHELNDKAFKVTGRGAGKPIRTAEIVEARAQAIPKAEDPDTGAVNREEIENQIVVE